MKNTIFLFCLILVSNLGYSQSGELPPVYFPSGKILCDNSPWQLVFQDYFDGNKLKSPWITFNSWDGMPGGDNEDWGEARCVYPYNAINLDANVEVSGGTVKLKVKKESTSWHCSTCTMTTRNTNYSTSCLRLPYTSSFNSGKFEASIKMPTFKFAHSTFWLWHGSTVNEIDIAEAYGWSGYSGLFGYYPKCNYSLHAWEPGLLGTPQNPYNMTHVEIRNHYPRQTWWDWITGRYFKQADWHTYTCEWDTTLIRFYLDGSLVNEFWKYYQDRSEVKGFWPFRHTVHYRVGSGCNPDPGTWHVTQGFPYNNLSESALNFTPGLDQDNTYSNNTVLGAMEIDYVKIWQKHPENGWHGMCDPALSSISGPDVICNTATYYAIPPSPSGYWLTPTSNLTVLSSNNASITVQKNPSSTGAEGQVYYYPLDPSCPNTSGYFLEWKRMFVGKADNVTTNVSETHSSTYHTVHYNLNADPHYIVLPNPIYNYTSPMTYEWFVDYGVGFTQHYHAFGQFISTPTISYTSGTNMPIKWTLNVTNACGTITKTGQMNYYLMRKAPNEQSDTNSNNVYAAAEITDVDAYNLAVEQRMAQTFIDINADEAARNEVFERIQMEELEPYILLDSSTIATANLSRKTNNTYSTMLETKIYPNPSTKFINIELSDSFQTSETVQLNIYDMFGSIKKQVNIKYYNKEILNLDISELPIGLYSIEIKQQSVVEHFKVLKQ